MYQTDIISFVIRFIVLTNPINLLTTTNRQLSFRKKERKSIRRNNKAVIEYIPRPRAIARLTRLTRLIKLSRLTRQTKYITIKITPS